MTSDAKIRAHLLSAFHGLRNSNGGWVPTSDMNLGGMVAVDLGQIRTVCEQLAEADLIWFKPLPGSDASSGIVGMSKITGHGSDVVEGLAKPRIAIEFARSNDVIDRQEDPSVTGLPTLVPHERPEDRTGLSSPSDTAKKAPESPTVELFTLKPSLWGVSIDLKEAYRRVRGRLVR